MRTLKLSDAEYDLLTYLMYLFVANDDGIRSTYEASEGTSKTKPVGQALQTKLKEAKEE